MLVAIAKAHTPNRAILEANRALASAAITQAQLIANPEVEVEGGLGRPRSGDGSEWIGRVALRQRFELPGKRSSRVSAAQAAVLVADQDSATFMVELETTVRQAAADFASATLASTVATQGAALAKDITDVAQRRTQAGEGDRGDVLRAELDQRQAAIAANHQLVAVDAGRRALSALCGGALPAEFSVVDAWAEPASISRDQALMAVDHHPLIEHQRILRAQRVAEIQREQAAARPDVTVGVFAGRGTDATEVGLSVGSELPFWNRNQGGIEAALAELQRSDAEIVADRRVLVQGIETAWREHEAAVARREALLHEVEPLAQELLDLRLKAFASGEVGMLDVVDARRSRQAVAEAIAASRLEALRSSIELQAALGTFSAFAPAPPETRP